MKPNVWCRAKKGRVDEKDRMNDDEDGFRWRPR